ncbi:hypothetical protein ACFL96_05195 [Thermoproteota archaeon]
MQLLIKKLVSVTSRGAGDAENFIGDDRSSEKLGQGSDIFDDFGQGPLSPLPPTPRLPGERDKSGSEQGRRRGGASSAESSSTERSSEGSDLGGSESLHSRPKVVRKRKADAKLRPSQSVPTGLGEVTTEQDPKLIELKNALKKFRSDHYQCLIDFLLQIYEEMHEMNADFLKLSERACKGLGVFVLHKKGKSAKEDGIPLFRGDEKFYNQFKLYLSELHTRVFQSDLVRNSKVEPEKFYRFIKDTFITYKTLSSSGGQADTNTLVEKYGPSCFQLFSYRLCRTEAIKAKEKIVGAFRAHCPVHEFRPNGESGLNAKYATEAKDGGSKYKEGWRWVVLCNTEGEIVGPRFRIKEDDVEKLSQKEKLFQTKGKSGTYDNPIVCSSVEPGILRSALEYLETGATHIHSGNALALLFLSLHWNIELESNTSLYRDSLSYVLTHYRECRPQLYPQKAWHSGENSFKEKEAALDTVLLPKLPPNPGQERKKASVFIQELIEKQGEGIVYQHVIRSIASLNNKEHKETIEMIHSQICHGPLRWNELTSEGLNFFIDRERKALTTLGIDFVEKELSVRVTSLVNEITNFTYINSLGEEKTETALTQALKDHDFIRFRLLIGQGIDPTQPNAMGEYPLEIAIDGLNQALKSGLDVNPGEELEARLNGSNLLDEYTMAIKTILYSLDSLLGDYQMRMALKQGQSIEDEFLADLAGKKDNWMLKCKRLWKWLNASDVDVTRHDKGQSCIFRLPSALAGESRAMLFELDLIIVHFFAQQLLKTSSLPFHQASTLRSDVLAYLAAHIASPRRLQECDENGDTPLHVLLRRDYSDIKDCKYNDWEMQECIPRTVALRMDPGMNMMNNKSETPLSVAIKSRKSKSLLAVLLKQGAMITCTRSVRKGGQIVQQQSENSLVVTLEGFKASIQKYNKGVASKKQTIDTIALSKQIDYFISVIHLFNEQDIKPNYLDKAVHKLIQEITKLHGNVKDQEVFNKIKSLITFCERRKNLQETEKELSKQLLKESLKRSSSRKLLSTSNKKKN